MDRKAWIVTTLCALGMVWYLFVYAPEIQRQQREYKERQRLAEEAKKPAEKPEKTGEGETTDPGTGEPVPPVPVEPEVPEELVELRTTYADGKEAAVFTLTNMGGGIQSVRLLDHTTNYDDQVPITLNGYSDYAIGALSRAIGDIDSDGFTRVPSDNPKEVIFETTTKELIKVRKVYSLLEPTEPGAAYRMDLAITFTNVDQTRRYTADDFYLYAGAMAALKPAEFMQPDYTSMLYMEEGEKPKNRDTSYLGKKKGRNYNPELDALQWGGPSNQYYVQNICADEPYPSSVWAERYKVQLEGFTAEQSEKHYAVHAGIGLPKISIDAGESVTFNYDFYLGPKTLKEFRLMGKDRDRIMRYNIIPILGGMAAPVSKLLMGIMLWLQGIVQNYGVAILILTVLLRTAMWPVYAKSQKTMKRMSKLSPKMQALREKYKDNPQKMQQETAKLFRENGMGPLGPLGGCLPMLIQIPVFLGFFQMLRLAVELRHEPFILWVTDLSQPDTLFTIPGIGLPINILPILMAVTMIWQMKITPSSGDAMQRRLMMIMPVIFLVFCYNFASALALYWTGQNLFSIGQTYLTRNKELDEPEKEPELTPAEIAKKRAAKGGPRTGGARAKKKKKK